MKLSLLIITIPERLTTFLPKMVECLQKQMTPEVELLALMDTKTLSLWAKRNKLMEIASGDYIIHLDDDDLVTDDFVEQILRGIESWADCITFNHSISINGWDYVPVIFWKDQEHTQVSAEQPYYTRKPNNKMCWRRSLALQYPQADISWLEDTLQADEMAKHDYTEHHIDKALYLYNYSDATSLSSTLNL